MHTELETYKAVSLFHSCSVPIKRIIRLGENTRILAYFIMDINVRNNYGLLRHLGVWPVYVLTRVQNYFKAAVSMRNHCPFWQSVAYVV